MIDVEAGAGCLGSSSPDTASDDKALGLVVVEAVLPMPPVVAGAGFPRCFAPDTASYDKTLGLIFQDACSGYRQWLIVLREHYWGQCMWMLCS